MSDNAVYNLSGCVLEWPARTIDRADLSRCPGLEFVRPLAGSHWEEYVFSSDSALRGEDRSLVSGPFRYTVVCRRSGARIALLSLTRHIVDHIVERSLPDTFVPNLRRVPISVDSLVKTIAARPTIYALSFVHARVPAFGASLRSVSFYGDDLADARLFRENMDLMNFFTCGLRRAVAGSEVVRLGSDGTLSFLMTGPERLVEVEEVLRFLRAEGYLLAELWSPK